MGFWTVSDNIEVTTKTLGGERLILRELMLSDYWSLRRISSKRDFYMPYLNGTRFPFLRPIVDLYRPLKYVFLATVSRVFSHMLFGARRHWLMAIETECDSALVGVVLVDGVVRISPKKTKISNLLLESHKVKSDSQIGDGEVGFFLDVDHRRRGIATQALFGLLSALSSIDSGCESPGPILRRIWAETGSNNKQARNLLESLGLVEVPEKTIDMRDSSRFDRDGSRLKLLHFDQNASDCAAAFPITALLDRLIRERKACKEWSLSRHKARL